MKIEFQNSIRTLSFSCHLPKVFQIALTGGGPQFAPSLGNGGKEGVEPFFRRFIWVVLVKKVQARMQKKNLSQSVFLLENPTHQGLETAVCPIFAKQVLDILAVCSLVPSINLSHTQQSYLCPKIKITYQKRLL